MTSESNKIEEIARPVVQRHGAELVDLSFRREAGGWVLRLLIDRDGGVGVDLCADISRDVSAELDVADFIDHAYTLEVSSPGLDRPLKEARDFQRYRGRHARVKTAQLVGGRKNFVGEIVGLSDTDDAVQLAVDGQTFTIPLAAISRANLKVEI